MSKIAVIGAGFYGSYIALKLADKGHKVILIDSEPIKTSEVKALFGITENSLSLSGVSNKVKPFGIPAIKKSEIFECINKLKKNCL